MGLEITTEPGQPTELVQPESIENLSPSDRVTEPGSSKRRSRVSVRTFGRDPRYHVPPHPGRSGASHFPFGRSSAASEQPHTFSWEAMFKPRRPLPLQLTSQISLLRVSRRSKVTPWKLLWHYNNLTWVGDSAVSALKAAELQEREKIIPLPHTLHREPLWC